MVLTVLMALIVVMVEIGFAAVISADGAFRRASVLYRRLDVILRRRL